MSYDFPALRCSFSQNTPPAKNTQDKPISYTKNKNQPTNKETKTMNTTYTLLHSYTAKKDKEADNKPRLIDYVEDFLTIGTNYITTKNRTHTTPDGTTEYQPLPQLDKNDPNYIKLPKNNTFAIPPQPSTLSPATRIWILIGRNNTERHIIRLEFDHNPEAGIDKTDPKFDPENSPLNNIIQETVANCTDFLPPQGQADAHDNWALRLLCRLYEAE